MTPTNPVVCQDRRCRTLFTSPSTVRHNQVTEKGYPGPRSALRAGVNTKEGNTQKERSSSDLHHYIPRFLDTVPVEVVLHEQLTTCKSEIRAICSLKHETRRPRHLCAAFFAPNDQSSTCRLLCSRIALCDQEATLSTHTPAGERKQKKASQVLFGNKIHKRLVSLQHELFRKIRISLDVTSRPTESSTEVELHEQHREH